MSDNLSHIKFGTFIAVYLILTLNFKVKALTRAKKLKSNGNIKVIVTDLVKCN